MIHTKRTVTVGNQACTIDTPVILYRGDREVEVEFEITGNKFTFTSEGNVIKSTNASHGQLVINTPSGFNMFSDVSECHDGKVVFVITKEMIDELIEVGFYTFQIRLYDGEELKSRATIPPVYNGIDIRDPIASEDVNSMVNYALVDEASAMASDSENGSIFLPNGSYNKTVWKEGDVISKARLNKLEEALYEIYEQLLRW